MVDRPLKPDEKKAWDQVRRTVRPLNPSRAVSPVRAVPVSRTSMAKPPSAPEPASPVSAPKLHRDRPVSTPRDRTDEKAVRRGKISISGRFDLHGHTQASAWSALPSFLSREQARGSRCVIVITGKGRDGEGVIRHNFLRWLEMPQARSLVSGYAQAHPRHGGSGAFYVFLRRR